MTAFDTLSTIDWSMARDGDEAARGGRAGGRRGIVLVLVEVAPALTDADALAQTLASVEGCSVLDSAMVCLLCDDSFH